MVGGDLAVLQNRFLEAENHCGDWLLVWGDATEEEQQSCNPEEHTAGFNRLVSEMKLERSGNV